MAGRGRPLQGQYPRQRVSFTLDAAGAEWLRATAQSQGISMSQALDRALTQARRLQRSTPARASSRARISLPRRRLDAFCVRHRIKRLSLFGSVLTDRFRPGSDVDALVEFEPGAQPGFFRLSELQEELRGLLGGRRVDLRSPAELSPAFRESVLRDAEVIYGSR